MASDNVFEADSNNPRDRSAERANSTRNLKLTSLLPVSTWEEEPGEQNRTTKLRRPIGFRVYLEAAALLAIRDFNRRRSRILPNLPALLDGCDLQISLTMRDTLFSPIQAARQLQEALGIGRGGRGGDDEDAFLTQQEDHSDNSRPDAIIGAARSAVSQTLSVLAGVYQLPQISATSTSASLDNKDVSPWFARTVPSNAGDAKALVEYLAALDVSHLGVIYVRDSFGNNFHSDILKEASLASPQIQVVSAPYDDDEISIRNSVSRLAESGVRYVFGIFNTQTWKEVILEATRNNIIAQPGYLWLFSEAQQSLAQPGFSLDARADRLIARALHGTGVLLLDAGSDNKDLDEQLAEFESSTQLQNELISLHVEKSLRDGFLNHFDWTYPGSALYQKLNYDAAMALGLAACRIRKESFTGPQLYESLLQTEFDGVTGWVSFDPQTGTRKADDLRFRVENIRLSSDLSSPETTVFVSAVAARLDFRAAERVQIVEPFVYFDNSTMPPKPLPPLAQDLSLISPGLRAFGWVLCGSTIAASLGWILWTWIYRNIDVVRLSQPIFLFQLCVGCVVMASTIIPLSLQEPVPQRGLDMACMASPWLFSMGFVTVFSALFSKSWRLNLLFRSGRGFRRVQVKARDVLWPFLLLLFANTSLLVFWTVYDPLRWVRIEEENDVDPFGRLLSSHGECQSQSIVGAVVMPSLTVIINAIALIFTNYQCFLLRTLPTDFNESFYIALTNASLLEALILGGPMLLLVRDSPSARFVVKSIMITIACLFILLPVFVPKYLQRNIRQMRRRQGGRRSYQVSVINGFSRQSFQTGMEKSEVEQPPRLGTSLVLRNDDYYVQKSLSAGSADSSTRSRLRNGSWPHQSHSSVGSPRSAHPRRPSNQKEIAGGILSLPFHDSGLSRGYDIERSKDSCTCIVD